MYFTLTSLEEIESPVTSSCKIYEPLVVAPGRSYHLFQGFFALPVITPNEEVFTNGYLIALDDKDVFAVV